MKLSRRAAGFLLAVAGWNVIIWSTFVRNLAMDHGRPQGFYVAHAVLIVVDLLIAVGLAVIGWRAWQATALDAGVSANDGPVEAVAPAQREPDQVETGAQAADGAR